MIRRLPQFEMMESIRAGIPDVPSALPCPFCGTPYPAVDRMKFVTVVCRKCMAEGPEVKNENPESAIREAIAKWNARAQ